MSESGHHFICVLHSVIQYCYRLSVELHVRSMCVVNMVHISGVPEASKILYTRSHFPQVGADLKSWGGGGGGGGRR